MLLRFPHAIAWITGATIAGAVAFVLIQTTLVARLTKLFDVSQSLLFAIVGLVLLVALAGFAFAYGLSAERSMGRSSRPRKAD